MEVRLYNYFLIFYIFASENKWKLLAHSKRWWRWKRRREHCPSPPTPSPAVISLFTVSLRRPHDLNAWTGVTHKRFRGRSQDFSKGGSQRLLTRLPCRPPRAHLYYRGMKAQMKAHINWRQEPLTKILYKKTNFKKSGLFNNGFYGQAIVMAISPPEYCRLFAQKKAYQGGVTGTPGPPLATPLRLV